MVLRQEERKCFFSNWLGLLAYVNDKHKIVKDFGKPKSAVGLKLESIIGIKNKLWQNIEIIDEYIDSIRDLSKNDIRIIKSWKKGISGSFIILKHLKKYTVFFYEKESVLYGVHGITSPISEMIPLRNLPVMTNTTLLPYKDIIIYDSIFQSYNVSFGPSIRREYNYKYRKIKDEKGIIDSLEGMVKTI